jgi:4-hydroxy-tetrahydrodipicolinate reductase
MQAIIFGGGRLGTAIAAALRDRGDPTPRIVGRPGPVAVARGHRSSGEPIELPVELPLVDVVFESSRGDAVAANVAAALAAGNRRFVIATTGWANDRGSVERLLGEARAGAVAASNFSLGTSLFGRLVDRAVELFGSLPDYDPYVVEWHRAAKADRPSGTALELSRRIIAAHPRKHRLADPSRDGPAEPEALELAVIRAGGSPGMHVVGFDAPGESLELRLTARDRSAYAAGALAAADWLCRSARRPGIHEFDVVVDELLGGARSRLAAVR